MSAKHTPGPWFQQHNFVFALNEAGYNRMTVQVQRGHITDLESTPIAELEAVARLIAAAPDLLNACQQALYALKGREHDGFLREAIAKATGSAA
jgi:hypothetical protein